MSESGERHLVDPTNPPDACARGTGRSNQAVTATHSCRHQVVRWNQLVEGKKSADTSGRAPNDIMEIVLVDERTKLVDH